MKRGWAVLLSLCFLFAASLAAAETDADRLMEELLSWYLADAGDLQNWVDGPVAEAADGNGGWILIALRQDGAAFDGTVCRDRLEKTVEETEIRSLTKALRVALTLQSLDSGHSFIAAAADRAAEDPSLMPQVFALHLLNNGARAGTITREAVMRRLLELQLEDGGWAVIGTACDADCTAMTLQALAPLTENHPEARAAAERGLAALSAIQLENGGFTGMGTENAESCAQVLLALSALGIDAQEDPRFIRNGHTVLDALARFRLADGSFAHDLSSGRRNDTATVQAFCALAGFRRARRGGGPLYVFDAKDSAVSFGPRTAASRREEPGSAAEEPPGRLSPLIPAGTVLGLGLLACAAALLRRKRNWRTYAFIAGATALGTALAFTVEIRSPGSYYGAAPSAETGLRTVISIRCDTVAGRNAYAPADGVILGETEIRLEEGRTAFDQLVEATRQHHLQMEYDGTIAGAYVRGIAYLYEYDFGNLSGWMYRINGKMADVGAGQYRMREGDRIDWVYTTNIGRDTE